MKQLQNFMNVLHLHIDLISFAKGDIEPTEENIILSYNKYFNKSVTKLTEAEYSVLASHVNIILREVDKDKQDAIARFVMIEQNRTYFKELIKSEGFFFSMFINLMSKLSVKIVKIEK